jgi:hypothetical protein
MTSIAEISVCIQTSSDSVPSTPSWLGEVALLISYLGQQGVLSAIHSQVRLARGRFGRDEVIDFLAVLFGYAGSRPAPCLATDRGAACTPASLEPGVCSWLHGAQARANRPSSHRRLASS